MKQSIPDKAWFEEWREPLQFFEAARAAHEAIGLPDLFLKRKWNYLLEAWAAGEFATLLAKYNPVLIRLGKTEPEADFFIHCKKIDLAFELTELLEADRRRGDEYRRTNERGRNVILFDPDDSYEKFLKMIKKALGKKARKQYNPRRHILLYNNVFIFENLPDKLPDIHERVKDFHGAFESIWVMHDKCAVQMWPPAKNGSLKSVS